MRADESDGEVFEWRAATGRLAPLIDGVEYFPAVRRAMAAAQRQILILGWELHSEIDLVRGDEAAQIKEREDLPIRLADLLEALVEARPELEVHLLVWEGASLFALERQFVPRMKRPWDRHPRIRLVWDRDTPALGSHHQKLVVVDDRVAFAGGMDLTQSRWDSHDHRVDDERRRKPGLLPFHGNPYHDAMVAFDGEAAAILGDWCRERWRRATGEPLDPPKIEARDSGEDDPWPEDVEPLLRDQTVSIVLTQPDFGGRPEKRQCEQAFLAQIRDAERLIYIETQYLAVDGIVAALCDRLREPDGPEVVLVLPFGCPGLLQSASMDTRRDSLLAELRDADEGGRFGVYWPALAAGSTEDPFDHSVYVHAKVMVIDDRLIRIGSANLNNRSMGLDTELDVVVEVDGPADREQVARFRRRLMSPLHGVDAEAIAEAEAERGSVVAAIESLRSGDSSLHPFEHSAPDAASNIALDIELADPSRPLDDVDVQTVVEKMAEQTELGPKMRSVGNEVIGVFRRSLGPILGLAALLVLAALFAFTPLRQVIDRESLIGTLRSLQEGPVGLLGVLGAFILLGSIGFPITVLIAAVGALIDAWWAAPLAIVGVLGASLAGFFVGNRLPWMASEKLAEGRLERIRNALENNAVLAIAALRNVPIAPFTVVNAALGLTGVGWAPYLLGTAIGMLPGTVLLSVFGRQIGDLLRDPTPLAIAGVVAAGAALVAFALLSQRLLRHLDGFTDGESSEVGSEERT